MKFRRSLETRAVVDLVPMIDVVFQLILFFLVSTTFAMLPGITLDLPQSSTSEGERTNGITISVEAAGTVWVNTEQVALEGLDAALDSLGSTVPRETVPVSLEADEMVPNGTIVRILDSLRRTGYTAVNLRTRE
ncbi:MAG TPA: biopolymer transporter ExbD [Treponemataceae bacterium]|jgi:biopolymer transport protein ExbD|nr:MAG: Biopolymer transport protein ExbD [Spirochaetes bacterium ADurb.Bin269]TAH50247.1 MAG: biopolymer transporter ExbD [Treponema sp.]HOC29181.1 biopolymer transporter ExbD [Treponemataceae bacterium]HPX47059.1 biopolymer transporter ExbD [Treponemataceae bacterium]HQL32009.1 biopolymer transporter ExbD [Treponemataceae bacterium]